MCQQLLTATEKESCVGTKNLRLLWWLQYTYSFSKSTIDV